MLQDFFQGANFWGLTGGAKTIAIAITRPSLEWYSQRFDEIARLFEENLNGLGLRNVRQMKCFDIYVKGPHPHLSLWAGLGKNPSGLVGGLVCLNDYGVYRSC